MLGLSASMSTMITDVKVDVVRRHDVFIAQSSSFDERTRLALSYLCFSNLQFLWAASAFTIVTRVGLFAAGLVTIGAELFWFLEAF